MFIIWYESTSFKDPPLVYQFLIKMMQFHLGIWSINLKIKNFFWCSLNDPQMHLNDLDISLVCRPIKLLLEISSLKWITACIHTRFIWFCAVKFVLWMLDSIVKLVLVFLVSWSSWFKKFHTKFWRQKIFYDWKVNIRQVFHDLINFCYQNHKFDYELKIRMAINYYAQIYNS